MIRRKRHYSDEQGKGIDLTRPENNGFFGKKHFEISPESITWRKIINSLHAKLSKIMSEKSISQIQGLVSNLEIN